MRAPDGVLAPQTSPRRPPPGAARGIGLREHLAAVLAAGIALICASPKAEFTVWTPNFSSDTVVDSFTHSLAHEPCAICCASGAAVGGLGEFPAASDAPGDGSPLPLAASVTIGALLLGAGGLYVVKMRRG